MTYREKTRDGITRLTGRASKPMSPLDAWPVGSIYISMVTTSPEILLGGGTWIRFAKGRMLIGVNETDPGLDVGGEFGGSSITVLTPDNIPPHTHDISHQHDAYLSADEGTHAGTAEMGAFGTRTTANNGFITGGNGQSGDGAGPGGLNGSAFSNMPPYIAVYIWRRTA